MRKSWFLYLLATIALGQSPPPTFNFLYHFQGPPNAWKPPMILERGGKFYGPGQGGTANLGCVFELTPPASTGGAWTSTILYSFQSVQDGGGAGWLVASNSGVFYGVTPQGGSPGCTDGSGCGTVFELTPPPTAGQPWTKTVLYTFLGGGDGFEPNVLAVGPNGVLYGITGLGGRNAAACRSGCGTVFSLTPPATPSGAWTKKGLYEFAGGADGWSPWALVATSTPDGRAEVYGITTNGGMTCVPVGGNGCGLAFALLPPAAEGGAWTKVDLHIFGAGADGAQPGSLNLGADGALYITTGLGGLYTCSTPFPSCGTVVRLEKSSPHQPWTETVLYDFQGLDDGAFPGALAIAKDGSIYGTTADKGANGFGTVFHLQPSTTPGGPWTETTLYTFTRHDGPGPTWGSLITGEQGVIYGTARSGFIEAPSNGLLFRVIP